MYRGVLVNANGFDYVGLQVLIRALRSVTRLMDDRVIVAIGEEACAHGVGSVTGSEGADLNVDELVWSDSGGGGVAFAAESSHEKGCVFDMRDGGNLDHVGTSVYRHGFTGWCSLIGYG